MSSPMEMHRGGSFWIFYALKQYYLIDDNDNTNVTSLFKEEEIHEKKMDRARIISITCCTEYTDGSTNLCKRNGKCC